MIQQASHFKDHGLFFWCNNPQLKLFVNTVFVYYFYTSNSNRIILKVPFS